MNASTPSAGSNAIQVAHVTVLPEGANRTGEPAITWLEGHWNFVAHALRTLAAGAFLTAIVLHPAIISRYVSSDGQLEKASQNLLYALEVVGVFAGVALLGLAAAVRRHTVVKERIVVGVLLAAGAVLGCTVLMEAGLRLVHSVGRPLQTSRHYFFSHDSLLGWRHRPGSVATFKNQRVAINSIGLRDDDLAPAGKGNSFRILFLGDSQVFGDGVSREDTFVELLQSELSHVDPINGAVIGYGTDQQLLYFEREGASLRPNLTLVGLNAYDLRDNISRRVRSGYEKPVFEIRANELQLTNVPVDAGSIVDQAQSWLGRSSHLYATAGRLVRGPGERAVDDERADSGIASDPSAQTVFPPPGQMPRALEVTRLILKRLAADARNAGGGFAVMFLPYRMDLGQNPEYHAQAAGVVEALQKWGASEGYAVLDLRAALRSASSTDAFLDAMHFSPEGHRVVARAARDWLIGSGLVPASTEAR